MMLTGDRLDEFRCNNPKCKTRLIDKFLFESIKIGDGLDMEHFRDEEGD